MQGCGRNASNVRLREIDRFGASIVTIDQVGHDRDTGRPITRRGVVDDLHSLRRIETAAKQSVTERYLLQEDLQAVVTAAGAGVSWIAVVGEDVIVSLCESVSPAVNTAVAEATSNSATLILSMSMKSLPARLSKAASFACLPSEPMPPHLRRQRQQGGI